MFARPASPLGRDSSGVLAPHFYAKGWNVRPSGGSMNFWHNGFMAGTASLLVGRYDGLGWAVIFNKDVKTDPIDPDLHVAANVVQSWPSWNLFGDYP